MGEQDKAAVAEAALLMSCAAIFFHTIADEAYVVLARRIKDAARALDEPRESFVALHAAAKDFTCAESGAETLQARVVLYRETMKLVCARSERFAKMLEGGAA